MTWLFLLGKITFLAIPWQGYQKVGIFDLNKKRGHKVFSFHFQSPLFYILEDAKIWMAAKQTDPLIHVERFSQRLKSQQ